jgi:hypothetical protein
MRLDEYIFRRKQNNIVSAKNLGISRRHLQRLLSGNRQSIVPLAKKFEEINEGKAMKGEMLPPENFPQKDGL